MSSNKQRRESERLRLQRQLEERRLREASRKRTTLILSVVGALVLVAVIVVVVVVANNGSGNKKKVTAASPPASASPTPTAAQTTASAAPVTPPPTPAAPCSTAPKGSTVTFDGLTVTGATNLSAAPKVTGKEPGASPTTLRCEDLVVGKGVAAKTSSQATVEYIGLVYKTGTVFQSSWTSMPATFGLAVATPTTQGVIAGFSQGIAGAGKVAPMKAGGRRVLIMPASVAYGANPPAGSNIPANADLVFVVDLQKIAS